MERYDAYLGLLSQEQEYLDRLLELAREKRESIFAGAGERIVSISNAEDSAMDALMKIRDRRRADLPDLYARVESSSGTYRGVLRQLLLESIPDRLRPNLVESLNTYESKLRQLRRESRINNTLLSDRLMVFHRVLEEVQSNMNPKTGYASRPAKDKRPPVSSATPSILLDQKV